MQRIVISDVSRLQAAIAHATEAGCRTQLAEGLLRLLELQTGLMKDREGSAAEIGSDHINHSFGWAVMDGGNLVMNGGLIYHAGTKPEFHVWSIHT